jgi:glycosyltransferase involved in cell wall biosynthesis
MVNNLDSENKKAGDNGSEMKKVLFVIHSLNIGGAETIMLQLLKSLDRNQFQLQLAVFVKGGRLESRLPVDVPVIDLHSNGHFASIRAVFQMIKTIKKEKPDRILSFTWGVNLVVLIATWLIGFKGKVIVSDRTCLGLSVKGYSYSFLRHFLIRKFYPLADQIVANSCGVAQNIIDEFGVPSKKVKTIYNGVDINEIERLKNEPIDEGIIRKIKKDWNQD